MNSAWKKRLDLPYSVLKFSKKAPDMLQRSKESPLQDVIPICQVLEKALNSTLFDDACINAIVITLLNSLEKLCELLEKSLFHCIATIRDPR